MQGLPWDHVVYFHLAGHTRYETHLLDSHDHSVCDEVWQLYGEACELSGGRSTLLEWDDQIPSFDEVRAEAWKAKAWRKDEAELRAATGYFVIRAADLSAATALAQTCPHLKYGGSIRVRPIASSGN